MIMCRGTESRSCSSVQLFGSPNRGIKCCHATTQPEVKLWSSCSTPYINCSPV